MNELWVARDEDEYLSGFTQRPIKEDGDWYGASPFRLPRTLFPDLRPGECKRLVLAEETSE